MNHLSMFLFSKDKGHIQIITNSANKKELEAIGFVDRIDKVKKPRKTTAKKPAVQTDDK